jgi:hypothetical protein
MKSGETPCHSLALCIFSVPVSAISKKVNKQCVDQRDCRIIQSNDGIAGLSHSSELGSAQRYLNGMSHIFECPAKSLSPHTLSFC